MSSFEGPGEKDGASLSTSLEQFQVIARLWLQTLPFSCLESGLFHISSSHSVLYADIAFTAQKPSGTSKASTAHLATSPT